MSRLQKTLRKYALAASTAMSERIAYPGNFVGSMFTYALFVFISPAYGLARMPEPLRLRATL